MFHFLVILALMLPGVVTAQHVRIYAVIAGNDDPANFMAGSSMGSGLWQSDDTGRSWKQLGWKHIKAFSMAHADNGRVLYLAAGNGVLKSTDHGQTWKVMTDWRVAEVLDVMVSAKMPNVVLAATAHGVIKSIDSGETWKPFHDGIAQPYSSRFFQSTLSTYVCNESGLYRSDDLARWEKVSGVPPGVRNLNSFKDMILTVGDSSMSLLHFDSKLTRVTKHEHALWDFQYVVSVNQRYVAGINGIGRLLDHAHVAYEGPKNVHALTWVGDQLFAGTLGDGIWVRSGTNGEWSPLALPNSQVWTLHKAYIR